MNHEPPARSEVDESELIRRTTAGQNNAARELVDRHLGALTRFAYRMLGDTAEAEDVAQETFLRLWRELPSWEPRAKLTTWLHRVAHNLCIDRLRALRRLRPGDEADRPDPAAGVATMLEEHQRAHAVGKALDALPDRQRAAITLVYHQGLSNREAAVVMEIEVDALESLLSRGRQNLRRHVKQYAPERRPNERTEPLP